jgi:polysaccharide pyruvyl transferase WcaK-like protein
MPHFLLYGHGGSFNHGAEAIVRTTAAAIRAKYPHAHITLSSHFPEQDNQFALPVDEIIAHNVVIGEKEKQAQDPKIKKLLAAQMYASALERITHDTTCIAVGGDNFCYPNWYRQSVFQERAAIVGAQSILWGASLEPRLISPDMLATLRTYTRILVRETISAHSLAEYGIESVILPDPAFSLLPASFPLPENFLPLQTVGINLSPLLTRLEQKPGIALESIRVLISHIINTTDMNIALIPHVVMPMDDDYSLLAQLYRSLPEAAARRVCLIDTKRSAAEYKYAISQCAFLVCARTHASIAAYSSGIPTLVLGYSTKAAGIGHDLDMDDFVLDITLLDNANLLVHKFTLLQHTYPKNLPTKSYAKTTQTYAQYI